MKSSANYRATRNFSMRYLGLQVRLFPTQSHCRHTDQSAGTGIRLEPLIKRAAENKIENEEFQQSTVRPAAEALARKFMLTLARQLEVLGGIAVPEDSDGVARQHVVAIGEIFSRAVSYTHLTLPTIYSV